MLVCPDGTGRGDSGCIKNVRMWSGKSKKPPVKHGCSWIIHEACFTGGMYVLQMIKRIQARSVRKNRHFFCIPHLLRLSQHWRKRRSCVPEVPSGGRHPPDTSA